MEEALSNGDIDKLARKSIYFALIIQMQKTCEIMKKDHEGGKTLEDVLRSEIGHTKFF